MRYEAPALPRRDRQGASPRGGATRRGERDAEAAAGSPQDAAPRVRVGPSKSMKALRAFDLDDHLRTNNQQATERQVLHSSPPLLIFCAVAGLLHDRGAWCEGRRRERGVRDGGESAVALHGETVHAGSIGQPDAQHEVDQR
jgi:hypothetical protein